MAILVIPSEVEESLAVSEIFRDVSTPLDMTKDGRNTSHSAFSGGRPDRISLLIGRPCRRVGLHRNDDVVWTCHNCHSADRARLEHFGGNDWFIPILAGRIFCLETFLAIRVALNSG